MASHRIFGRQLSRDTEHRRAMRRHLVQSLFEHGSVRTTLPKAKEVQPLAERMITLARRAVNAKGEDAARVRLLCRRRVLQTINDRRLVDKNQEFLTGDTRTVVQRLFNEIAPKFTDRNGGYTRIIKTADYRIGDGGSIVILQLTTHGQKPTGTIRNSLGLRRKRKEKRKKFANEALKSRRSGGGASARSADESAPPNA